MENEMVNTRSRLLSVRDGKWNAYEPCAGTWLRYRNTSRLLPDLADESTGGILLGILRRIHEGSITVTPTDRSWCINTSLGASEKTYTGSSLAEVCAMVVISVSDC
jgi:hypothetical protein